MRASRSGVNRFEGFLSMSVTSKHLRSLNKLTPTLFRTRYCNIILFSNYNIYQNLFFKLFQTEVSHAYINKQWHKIILQFFLSVSSVVVSSLAVRNDNNEMELYQQCKHELWCFSTNLYISGDRFPPDNCNMLFDFLGQRGISIKQLAELRCGIFVWASVVMPARPLALTESTLWLESRSRENIPEWEGLCASVPAKNCLYSAHMWITGSL